VPPPALPTIDVTLADTVALESRTKTQATPQQAEAPEEGVAEPDAAPPPPAAEPEPQPKPTPREVAKPEPQPVPKPKPAPVHTPPKQTTPKPTPKPPEPRKPAPVAKPTPAKPAPAKAVPAKPAPAKTPPAKSPPGKATGTTAPAKPTQGTAPQRAPRLGADFLKGLNNAPAARPSANTGSAAPLGAAAARALNAEINRQIKPHWKAPTGADIERLVTIVSVTLDRNGNVTGKPEIVSQTGITPSNMGQRDLHAENAIRAIRLAAPFRLPPDLYDAWRSLEIKFDRRLSQ
jgi:outer membrane biosynthesis protein TonB